MGRWDGPAFLAAVFLAISLPTAQGQQSPDDLAANPGRPTVSTPATLTPVGYFQFESGYLYAQHSPEFSSQSSLNEVIKLAVSPRIEFLVSSEPFAHSRADDQSSGAAGGVSLGAQGVLYPGEGARPTIAVSYFREIYNGNTPDLDIGSAKNSVLLLASADVRNFHYDINFLFNDVIENSVHRAQFGQTLSISHALVGKFGLSGEIWRFTQPFLKSNAVGNLWALNYNLRKNLVLDCGFNHGFTSSSTRWEVEAGFTYLLPDKLRLP